MSRSPGGYLEVRGDGGAPCALETNDKGGPRPGTVSCQSTCGPRRCPRGSSSTGAPAQTGSHTASLQEDDRDGRGWDGAEAGPPTGRGGRQPEKQHGPQFRHWDTHLLSHLMVFKLEHQQADPYFPTGVILQQVDPCMPTGVIIKWGEPYDTHKLCLETGQAFEEYISKRLKHLITKRDEKSTRPIRDLKTHADHWTTHHPEAHRSPG